MLLLVLLALGCRRHQHQQPHRLRLASPRPALPCPAEGQASPTCLRPCNIPHGQFTLGGCFCSFLSLSPSFCSCSPRYIAIFAAVAHKTFHFLSLFLLLLLLLCSARPLPPTAHFHSFCCRLWHKIAATTASSGAAAAVAAATTIRTTFTRLLNCKDKPSRRTLLFYLLPSPFLLPPSRLPLHFDCHLKFIFIRCISFFVASFSSLLFY